MASAVIFPSTVGALPAEEQIKTLREKLPNILFVIARSKNQVKLLLPFSYERHCCYQF